LSSFLIITAEAQQKPSVEIGAKLMIEANSSTGGTMPFSGLQLVYQKRKHGGLETGLYYRPVRNTYIVTAYNGSTYYYATAIVAERFLSIPVLYRFQSKLINFTAGTSLDLYLGWKDKSDKNTVTVNSNNRSGTIEAGAVVSINKSIHLNDKLILEPEIRFNPIFTSGDPYAHYAFGFACRYKL
jgi:YHS domain-containing protein